MHTTTRTTIDAFHGTARELLRLLRDLHNGTGGTLAGMTRLQSIQATCDAIAAQRAGVTL